MAYHWLISSRQQCSTTYTMVEFNNVEYAKLLAGGYKFIEIRATGQEIESSTDYYRKVVHLVPHITRPEQADHYIVDITDTEIDEIANGNDTDIFFVQNT